MTPTVLAVAIDADGLLPSAAVCERLRKLRSSTMPVCLDCGLKEIERADPQALELQGQHGQDPWQDYTAPSATQRSTHYRLCTTDSRAIGRKAASDETDYNAWHCTKSPCGPARLERKEAYTRIRNLHFNLGFYDDCPL